MSPAAIALSRPRAARRPPLSLVLAVAGALALVPALVLGSAAAWTNLLLAGFALAAVGAAGPVFVALYHLTGARWGDRILGVPRALEAALPVGGVLLLVAIAAGAGHLYPWADAERVHGDAVLSQRAAWMSLPWVLLRTAGIVALWVVLGRRVLRRSLAAEASGDPGARSTAARAGALFLVVFAPTFSLLCFDTLLSLEAHWPSTIFALYHFAGLFEAGVAVLVLGVLHLRRRGVLAADPEVLHDLGKLLFAFAFLWGYLWFCQYMLVWYTNLPEETAYYAVRHGGGWEPLAVANVLLNWTLPFVLLLSRAGKRSASVLARAAGLALVGRWLDLYLAIEPTVAGEHGLALLPLVVGLAVAAGLAGGLTWALPRRLGAARPSEPARGA